MFTRNEQLLKENPEGDTERPEYLQHLKEEFEKTTSQGKL